MSNSLCSSLKWIIFYAWDLIKCFWLFKRKKMWRCPKHWKYSDVPLPLINNSKPNNDKTNQVRRKFRKLPIFPMKSSSINCFEKIKHQITSANKKTRSISFAPAFDSLMSVALFSPFGFCLPKTSLGSLRKFLVLCLPSGSTLIPPLFYFILPIATRTLRGFFFYKLKDTSDKCILFITQLWL